MAHMQNIEGRIPGPNAEAPVRRVTQADLPIDGIERRISSTAVQYWRELAAPRRYPGRTQVTRESAPCAVGQFLHHQGRPRCRRARVRARRRALREALGCDPTGRIVGDVLPREIVGRALYFQKAACDLMAPIDEAGRFTRADGVEIVYRAVLLPLSDDQRVANHLLGAFSFRAIVNH